MRKHSENSSNQFMSSGKDSLSKGQAVFSSFKEIILKEGIKADNAEGHKVDKSSKVTIASLRDFSLALKLAGLINSRVETCKSNKGLIGGEIFNIADLSEEHGSGGITDTVYGSENFHLGNCNRGTGFRKDVCYFVQPFHQMKERRDFLRQDEFLGKAYRSDRAFCCFNNLIGRDREFSALAGQFKGMGDSLGLGRFDTACRGEFFEEKEHCCRKDIGDGLKFRESALKDSFDFIFDGSDEPCKGFSLSGNVSEVFDVLGDGELRDGIFMYGEKLGNSERVFLVGLCFSQGELSEIRDQQRINDGGIETLRGEEGKEIDVIAAGGFHSGKDCGRVLTGGIDSLEQLREPFGIHSSRHGKADIAFGIYSCGSKRILGDINPDKELIQNITSVKSYSCKAGKASRPILHADKGSETQSTYYGYGRQGTDSFEGSMTQVIWSSPALPTSMGKTHLYKCYNTNS